MVQFTTQKMKVALVSYYIKPNISRGATGIAVKWCLKVFYKIKVKVVTWFSSLHTFGHLLNWFEIYDYFCWTLNSFNSSITYPKSFLIFLQTQVISTGLKRTRSPASTQISISTMMIWRPGPIYQHSFHQLPIMKTRYQRPPIPMQSRQLHRLEWVCCAAS